MTDETLWLETQIETGATQDGAHACVVGASPEPSEETIELVRY